MTEVTLRVVPNAKRASLVRAEGGGFRLRVDAPPVDGKANKRAIQVLARKIFGLPRSRVTLVRGRTSRTKTFAVDLPKDEVLRLMELACGSD